MVGQLAKRLHRVENPPATSLTYDQVDLSKLTDEELEIMIQIAPLSEEERSESQNQTWKKLTQKTIVV